MNGQRKGTSPWVWVGLGCLGAVLLAVAAVAAVGVFGYRKVKQLEADLKDPSARADKVKRVLGTDRLPPGYHAVMAMSVPLVMDMAMLSDVEPDFDRGGRRRRSPLGQRGFFYVQTLSPGNDKQELRDYFEGRSDDADVLRRNHVKLDRRGETLRRGTLPLDGGTLMYIAQRGELDMAASRAQGITTMMLLDCPGDEHRQRFGIWFGPEPAALAAQGGSDAPSAEALAGTPADESAIREFMDHFRLCRG